ncbi:ferric-chelate reductase [Phaeosphaeria sp. MPI-PUGE-AT-0046c]|nr:ferric-chelate reductase [Phaeosphaeria sp. MPI-PUGE-AT-0046c]
MHILSCFLSLIALLHVTQALLLGKFCPSACEFTLQYVTFNDTDAWLSRKVRACRSQLLITSVYLCFDQYCEYDVEGEKWIHEQSLWCDEHAGVKLPEIHDVLDKWTAEDIASVRRLGLDEAQSGLLVNEVLLPDSSFHERAYTTMFVADQQYALHLEYGWYMYYFWILVVFFGVVSRLLSILGNFRHRRRRHISNDNYLDSHTSTRSRPFVGSPAWLKRHLTVPATFGNRCSAPYGWCTIPPRIQSATILLFVVLNFVLCTFSYRLTEGNLYWPEKSAQLLRYVSDRTGVISLVNFPLVWLFGMRNDVLLWLTGWGFGTYNAFHRWIARVATLQAVIHSLGYTLMIFESGGWSGFSEYLARHYFWNGELATIAMCALLAFSLYGIRRAHYEIFLVTHIVLSIVALWTMYYHVEIFVKGEWTIFIWPCLVIWVCDRVLRTGRILAFNRHFWRTRASASYDPSSNLIRMDVDGSNNWLAPEPGTYYYIHVLDDLLYAHQSHPFTLAYNTSNLQDVPSTPLSPLSARPAPHRTLSDESTESDALLTSTKSSSKNNLVFLIRPYDGFTARLKSHCLLHPTTLRVLIDGPYGHAEPLHHFPHVLFIVGGTGVAVPLSHISRLLSPASRTHSLKIVWAVREHAFLASVLRDFAGLLGDERVDMQVHVTQDKEVVDEVLGEDLKSVRVVARRPDVRGVVARAAEDAGRGGLAVVACGPAMMADEARKASVEMLARGHAGVDYFEESFKW